jgi:predicted ATP-dependent endonuclease of OLD family
MNEQLIVKNFGPIKDATVDFKRVTVFIGPTGGGKSTLAKLAAIFKNEDYSVHSHNRPDDFSFLKDFKIEAFSKRNSYISYESSLFHKYINFEKGMISATLLGENQENTISLLEEATNILKHLQETITLNHNNIKKSDLKNLKNAVKIANANVDKAYHINKSIAYYMASQYIPAERIFLSSLEYSWPGLMRDDIGLPKILLDFANSFSLAKKSVGKMDIHFMNVRYIHKGGRDFIKVPGISSPLMLLETASGIQSVTPLLVLLEHLSRNTEQAQSFIIEEPELNLYPTAQQGLLNWLVEKCTKGENDLTITTHSPYILSHLNLLLYAYQVAEKHPDRKEAVAAIVPEASWINPKEFACYQVENGGVQSLVDEDLGLIDNNELDGLSGDAADAFDNLIRLSKGFAIK